MMLLTVAMLQVQARGFSQSITFSARELPLKQVLSAIEQQSDYVFFYNNGIFRHAKPVTFAIEKGTLEEALEASLAGQGLDYMMEDKTIMIYPKGQRDIPRPTDKAKQPRILRGSVRDTTGAPLVGASVSIKGTDRGVSTNAAGQYQMRNVPKNAILVFSMLGFETAGIPVGNRTTVDVVLKATFSEVDEVVVVGYGTQKKGDVTGAIASVSSAELEKTVNTSFIDALTGRAAGVQVLSGEGSPGGGASIRVRGGTSISASNEPLYVIDGFPIIDDEQEAMGADYAATASTNILAGINPSDIESIQILKDASATAIYGARGANGVVIITTKSGQVGQPTITYNAYAGIKNLTEQLTVMDALQYATYQNIRRINNEENPFENPERYADSATTNWQDAIYRQAVMQNHVLGMSGGVKNIKYNTSFGYFNDQGIIKTSAFDRFTGRLNLRGNISPKMRFSTLVSASFVKQDGAATGGTNNQNAGVVNQALFFPPVIPNENLEPTSEIGGSANYSPLSVLNEIDLENTADRLMGNVSVEYDITKALTFKVMAGANVLNQKRNAFHSSRVGAGAAVGGRVQIRNANNRDWVNENTLTYDKQFGKHHLTVLGGGTLQSGRRTFNEILNFDFDIEDLGFNNIGLGTNPVIPKSSVDEWSIASGLGRVNYQFDERYLVTLSLRADGSSRFAKGNKWGYFPAAAFAWRLSNEAFLKDVKAISDLKLRLGYGVTGNQEVQRYQSLSSLGVNFYSFGTGDGGANIAVGTDRVANPDLTWEKTTQYNLGLDVGLFKNRLNATVDAFHKKTEDLLLAINLIPSAGVAAPALQNIGSLQNTGLEIGINSKNIAKRDFEWSTSFNISFIRNKVLDLGPYEQIFVNVVGGSHTVVNEVILQPGSPIGTFYGYQTDGIVGLPDNPTQAEQRQAGRWNFVDQNGDGVINDDDRVILGNAQPKHYGGFTNDLRYKNLDLSVFFNWSYGNSVYNANRIYLEEITDPRNKSPIALEGSWTSENQDAELPAIGKSEVNRLVERYIEDGSFLRLRNVTLGYTLRPDLLKRTPLKTLRVYAMGQNLLTWTNYKGYNPEANVNRNPVAPGIDWAAYPLSRIYTFGVQVKF
ncbi:TonB-dependent receptor [Parapedobacter tibetensis]|uniref:TonB-dependent receptor n=1 Tax=Parapedobacter tibetensis TaxID=2972951 RepID=UPI00214D65D3|nr:TonB-dependent receptor [Parapedobacter tibetensis]